MNLSQFQHFNSAGADTRDKFKSWQFVLALSIITVFSDFTLAAASSIDAARVQEFTALVACDATAVTEASFTVSTAASGEEDITEAVAAVLVAAW